MTPELWTLVHCNKGTPVLPLEGNPGCQDEGLLVYQSRFAVEMAACNQHKFYRVLCRRELLQTVLESVRLVDVSRHGPAPESPEHTRIENLSMMLRRVIRALDSIDDPPPAIPDLLAQARAVLKQYGHLANIIRTAQDGPAPESPEDGAG